MTTLITQNSLLLTKLLEFYNRDGNMEKILPIINGESIITRLDPSRDFCKSLFTSSNRFNDFTEFTKSLFSEYATILFVLIEEFFIDKAKESPIGCMPKIVMSCNFIS